MTRCIAQRGRFQRLLHRFVFREVTLGIELDQYFRLKGAHQVKKPLQCERPLGAIVDGHESISVVLGQVYHGRGRFINRSVRCYQYRYARIWIQIQEFSREGFWLMYVKPADVIVDTWSSSNNWVAIA